jgi:hypothetical protein
VTHMFCRLKAATSQLLVQVVQVAGDDEKEEGFAEGMPPSVEGETEEFEEQHAQ